jgi:hypothetical protein
MGETCRDPGSGIRDPNSANREPRFSMMCRKGEI